MLTAISVLMILGGIGMFIYFFIYAVKYNSWKVFGGGERQAKAAYGKTMRESPGSIHVSEAEFVDDYVKTKGPSFLGAVKLIAIMVVLFIGGCLTAR